MLYNPNAHSVLSSEILTWITLGKQETHQARTVYWYHDCCFLHTPGPKPLQVGLKSDTIGNTLSDTKKFHTTLSETLISHLFSILWAIEAHQHRAFGESGVQ